MKDHDFLKIPESVPRVHTKYRTIRTKIPVPGSIAILEALERYESRSMRGQLPVVWDRAEGFQVADKYGNRWIDFTSSIFLANAGHSNPAVFKALRAQLDRKLVHTYTFANEARLKFLKKLIAMTPPYLKKAFLLSAGTEAAECAVKLMRMHGRSINPSKTAVISFRGNMHGRTMCAEMLKGDAALSSWIGYQDPNIYHLPFPYPWTLDSGRPDKEWARMFRRDMAALKKDGLDPRKICGFMIESYQGWGAVFYPKTYIKELSMFAAEHGALVAFDDIQGGFGRTGKLFAYQHYGVRPDLVCLGKALGGGVPLSAVLGRKDIMDLPETGSMSSTHSANPLCCAAALANLEEIESRGLVAESARKGKMLHSYLRALQGKYRDRISYVFGKGLAAAILMTDPRTRKPDTHTAGLVCKKAMEKGLLLVHTGRESIKIGPPLVITDEALLEGLAVLEVSIREACGGGK
jgi:4-aminobutyrate aminotransferase / (S)-3-amino-2-methylpropionate transaminase / 5-aminovalerate transaminase